MFVRPFYFVSYYVSYYVYWIEYDDYFFFIFRRPIIIGRGRDTGMIFWPIRNSIQICGWMLARQVDPIKIRFTGSPTLQPTTCGRPVVFQPLGAPNQYRAPNLRSSWPCSNTRLSSPTNTNHLSAEYAQLKASQAQQKAEFEQQKAAYEQLRFVWSWTWQHIVEHVRLILFGHITTSLLQDLLLLLQLHLYINL